MGSTIRPLAVVTGGSSGIGLELARQCLEHGFDVIIAADRSMQESVADLQSEPGGGKIETVECDLATRGGVSRLLDALDGREPEALLANAGHGLGGAFLDQSFDEVTHVIDTNITGTLYLIQRIGQQMQARGAGRILITGSIAGFMPGSFHAVYNGTKAFIDSFSWALRNELRTPASRSPASCPA